MIRSSKTWQVVALTAVAGLALAPVARPTPADKRVE